MPALADDKLDPGGLTFRDFSTNDNGASYGGRGDPMIAGGPNQVSSKVVTVEGANGLARIQFSSIRVELALPLGWQATEDWERGVAYSSDKRYRVLVWRVDFAYEGVKDAEHYAATKAGSIQARRPTRSGAGPQAGRRHVPDRLRQRQNARRRRTKSGVRPGDPKAGRPQGGHPVDLGCAGE